MNLPFYIYLLIPCFIIGLAVYFQKSAPFYLKVLPVLLAINIIVELVGQWMVIAYGSNTILFNFYMAFLVTAHMYMLSEMVVKKQARKLVRFMLLIYPFVCLYNIFFGQGLDTWQSYTYLPGNVIIVSLSVYYFFELFKRPTFINLMREPAFWICSAFLFYYMCSFPFLGMANLLRKAPTILLNNLSTFLNLLNVMQYTLFAIAFLCRVQFNRRPSTKIA